MKINRVCVLGGTGFVGHHLINRLCRSRREVRVLTRGRERHRDLLVLPTLELVEADVHDYASLTRHFRGCDAVINLVGILHADQGGFHRTHVALPENIVRACRETGVARLLHVSALRASAEHGTSEYLRSKGRGEDVVMAAAAEGLQPTAFRPAAIFGPGDTFVNRFVGLIRLSPPVMPLPCPNARFAPVYVKDVVTVYERALDDHAAVGQRFELCGPKVYSLRSLIEYFARAAGKKRRIVGLGDGLSRVAAISGQWLPGKPFSLDNLRSMQRDSVCGLDDATDGMAAFGLQPTSLEAIVPAMVAMRRPSH